MRSVFFSFAWEDVWRVNQVRNSGIVKGCRASGFIDTADIESVKSSSDRSIKQWIDTQMKGTSVTCVLIGSRTISSKWVKYEIEKSIEKGNGILGVYIHNMKNQRGLTSMKGKSPIPDIRMGILSRPHYVHYDWTSQYGYKNFGKWVEEAAERAGR